MFYSSTTHTWMQMQQHLRFDKQTPTREHFVQFAPFARYNDRSNYQSVYTAADLGQVSPFSLENRRVVWCFFVGFVGLRLHSVVPHASAHHATDVCPIFSALPWG